MLDPRRNYLSLRGAALLTCVLFAPIAAAFIVNPDAAWGEYLGVFFHLSILFVVSRLDAASWAKAAGYGWVAVDVTAGIMAINDVPYDIYWPLRLGGHVLAGVWVMSSSLVSKAWPVIVVGTIVGFWLASYSLVGDVLSESWLAPAGMCLVVWLVLVAIFQRQAEERPETAASPASV